MVLKPKSNKMEIKTTEGTHTFRGCTQYDTDLQTFY